MTETAQELRDQAAALLARAVALDNAGNAPTMNEIIRGRTTKVDVFAKYREPKQLTPTTEPKEN